MLVIAIVFLFLASLRATGITVLAIPLSLVTAVLAMRAFGGTINTMTLGGMAIAVGALVDDAIIDVENVVRRLRENGLLPESERQTAIAVVFDASKEIRGSIVYATVIIVLVFLPLFFLSGVEGRLLQPLGFAYVVSLAASLVVALTVTPVLCSLLLPTSRAVRENKEGAVVHWLKARYAPILAAVLPRWKGVLGRRARARRPCRGRPRPRRACLPPRLQRGDAHALRGDPARERRSRSPTGWAASSRRRCSAPGGGRHGAPHGPRGARRARAGRELGGDRRRAEDGQAVEGGASSPRSGRIWPSSPG